MFPRAAFPLTPSQLTAAIEVRSDSTVAELDGKAAAFANFYRWETGGSCAIGNVAVAPEVRCRGVGRSLVLEMIDIAVSRHRTTEVHISCFNANVIGMLLYTKLGFQPFAVEERRDDAGRRAALIHFRLPLRIES
ncbi:GNAT family N-acetyltransferase [Desulfonatronum parangueonense]